MFFGPSFVQIQSVVKAILESKETSVKVSAALMLLDLESTLICVQIADVFFFSSAVCQMWMSVKYFPECASMANASTHRAPFSASVLRE